MKEGFDAAPIGVRITRRDMQILRHLTKVIYPGITLTLSDVARVLMREAMLARGIQVVPETDSDPFDPKPKKRGRRG